MSMDPTASTPGNQAALRPIERRIVRLVDGGVDTVEIARRFQRSPEFIGRVIEMAGLPGRGAHRPRHPDEVPTLRPVERCILAWLDRGGGPADIARRLRRSTNFVERIEGFARYKLALR